jgi:hypothetical protein
LHEELMLLVEQYRAQKGETFPVPTRSEGGWREGVMQELIAWLKALLV